MKLIIKNYNIIKYKTDIHIYILNKHSIKVIPYKDLLIKDNQDININIFTFVDGIYKILLSKNKFPRKKLIYEFYDNNKLLCKLKCTICCIQIKNNKIQYYDSGNFIKNYQEYIKRHKLFIIRQWNLYWYNLHWLAYNYPDNPNKQDKNEIIKLINVMKTNGIKCTRCKKHFNKWIKKNKIQSFLSNKLSLFTYFFNLHNNVNERKKKKILNLKEAYFIYKNKNWERKLSKYGVSIVNLFKERKLETFPELFYSIIKDNLKKEYNL